MAINFPRPQHSWIKRVLVAGTLAGVLGFGTWQLHFIHARHRLEAVRDGQLYRSGVIPPGEIASVARRLKLKTVIDFRTSREGQDATNTTPMALIKAEGDALTQVGVRHIHLPTPQVPSQATVDAFLRVLADPANRPVLIHCHHGIGRTELFAALYRIEFEGWDPERAWKATRFFLPGSSFSRTAEKGRFLLGYRPHALRLPPRTQVDRVGWLNAPGIPSAPWGDGLIAPAS